MERQNYYSPICDWIPHDLYLLNNLGIDIHHSKESINEYSKKDNFHLSFKAANQVSVNLVFKKISQKNFSWKITCKDSSRILINFTNHKFSQIQLRKRVVSLFDKSNFNQAIAILEYFSNTRNSNLKLLQIRTRI